MTLSLRSKHVSEVIRIVQESNLFISASHVSLAKLKSCPAVKAVLPNDSTQDQLQDAMQKCSIAERKICTCRSGGRKMRLSVALRRTDVRRPRGEMFSRHSQVSCKTTRPAKIFMMSSILTEQQSKAVQGGVQLSDPTGLDKHIPRHNVCFDLTLISAN
jgi:hypothetical protein